MKDKVQSLLNAGDNISKIASSLSVHHEVVRRLISKHNLEIYVAFDECVAEPPTAWVINSDFRVVNSRGADA